MNAGTAEDLRAIVTELLSCNQMDAVVDRLAAIVQASDDAIISKSLAGTILSWNPAAERIYGYAEAEALGQPISIIVPADLSNEIPAIMQRLRNGERIEHYETMRRKKNGQCFPVSISWSPLKNAAGKVVGAAGIARDITERKRAEELIRESERRYRTLIDTIPQLVWTCKPDGACDYLSPQWVAYTGIPAREHIGFGWVEQLHPEDRDRVHTAWMESVQESRDFDIEFRLRRADGAYRWFKSRGVPIRSEAGRIIKWQGTSTDLQEKKETEEALQRVHEDLARRAEELARSNRELEQFAYVASHDLQEPLRMVASYLELLSQRYKGRLDEKADKFIDYAVDGAVRMKALIDGLLGYSRVATRARSLALVESRGALDEARTNLGRTIGEKGAVVTSDALPLVLADHAQLVQVFQNLIGNALKFCAGPPLVHVAVEPKGEEWVFSVRDNGIGIARECWERIFAIFQRLHGRDKYPGTGMGLAICKTVVERHGGRIWVESRPGEGSTFFFTLPVTGKKSS